MDRRAFLVNSAQFACLLKLAMGGLFAEGAAVTPAIADLYRKTLVIDACAAIRADSLDLPVRSMGMSDDLEVALSEGSTMLRLGRALFGDRAPRRAGRPAARHRSGEES